MRFSYIFVSVSVIVSIVVSFLVFNFTSFYSFKGFNKALEGVLLFSSISLGFYGACLSVIASIFNTKVMKEIMGDRGDKKELIFLVSSTLIAGFSTVALTILYQVFIENGNMSVTFYDFISSVWSGFVILFISMIIIFTLVSFLILFNNRENENKEKSVYNPTLNNSPFK